MNRKEKIEKEVAKAMLLLEKGEKRAASPFLEERLIANLETVNRENFSTSRASDFLKPAFFVILFLVNLLSFWLIMNDASGEDNDTALREKYLSQIAGDYNLVQEDYFIYNNK